MNMTMDIGCVANTLFKKEGSHLVTHDSSPKADRLLLFLKLGFTPCRKQPLRAMESQEKEAQKD